MCVMLRKKLDDAGIPYQVSEDLTEIIDAGFSHVPILKVNGVYMKSKEAIAWVNSRCA